MQTTLDPALPVLDLQALVERMMGSVDMARRMVALFIDNAAEEIDAMESIIRIGNRDEIASAAHRHKGTARTLAADRVAFWAANIEEAASEVSTADLLAMVNNLREEHQRLRYEIENDKITMQGLSK